MNLLKKTLALITLITMFILSLCACKEETHVLGFAFPFSLYTDVIVENGFVTTVDYPEDGSFEEKQDVFALKVKNVSDKDIQLLRVKVTTDRKEMFFEITTLPVNMSVNAFEKSGQTLEDGETILDISAENRVDFEKPIGLQRELFELDVHDKIINVRNISKEDINTDIYLYYKKKDTDGSYFGGITFRAKISGLKAGELKQVSVPHFALSDSEVIFLDYAGK